MGLKEATNEELVAFVTTEPIVSRLPQFVRDDPRNHLVQVVGAYRHKDKSEEEYNNYRKRLKDYIV
jgi:hypothetical protein